MLSSWLIKVLIVEYAIIMIVCICERNWARTLYWSGALILNYSLLLMK